MNFKVIQLQNGLQANEPLNKLASLNEKIYKSPNLKFGFDINEFSQGLWEYKIINTKTNKGIILTESNNKNYQKAFVYLQSIETTDNQVAQTSHDHFYQVKNQDLFKFCRTWIEIISK